MKLSIVKENRILVYLTFFIWPAFALLLGVVNMKKAYAKNTIWLFCVFIGLTIVLPYSYENHDLVRYRDNFEALTNQRNVPFLELFLRPYQHGLNSDLDFYLNFMNILISRFTDSFRMFLVIISVIFGYFFSRNLTFVIHKYSFKNIGVLSAVCLLILAFLYPVWAINGYRFNTAAMVFIYGLLHYFDKKSTKHLIIILATPLIHFSFALPIFVLALYSIIGKRFTLYFLLVIAALIYSGANPSHIYENASLAPGAYQNKIKGYTEGGYVDVMASNIQEANWYVAGHLMALKLTAIIFIVIIWFKRRHLFKDVFSTSLISYGSLLFALSLTLESIPAMERFMMVAVYIIICGAISILHKINLFKNPFTFFLLLSLSFIFLIVKLRIGAEEIGIGTFVLNPLIAPFFESSKSILDFIKG